MPTEETTVPLLTVEVLPDYEPTIGRWLWLLEETRRETKETLIGLDPAALDWMPPQGTENTIGTLLYHIGLIELDWLYTEVLENQPWPDELQDLFAVKVRDAEGNLSSLRYIPLEQHLRRLDRTRRYLLASFQNMSLEEFRRPRAFPQYRVTAEWVLHHLIQHEVEHRGHIQLLRSLADQSLNSG